MNTCGTCKYFGKLVDELFYFDDDSPKADESGMVNNQRLHVCELLKHLNKSCPFPLEEVAGVIDGSGYRATFCVSEEFGCNQWAQRLSGEG